MPKVIFVTADGKRQEHEVRGGWSVMQGAMRNSVPGIDAECGGSMACATCHVFVEEPWLEKLGEPDEMEVEMLELLSGRQPNSRLSCQIFLTDQLDGIVVRVPEEQVNVEL